MADFRMARSHAVRRCRCRCVSVGATNAVIVIAVVGPHFKCVSRLRFCSVTLAVVAQLIALRQPLVFVCDQPIGADNKCVPYTPNRTPHKPCSGSCVRLCCCALCEGEPLTFNVLQRLRVFARAQRRRRSVYPSKIHTIIVRLKV